MDNYTSEKVYVLNNSDINNTQMVGYEINQRESVSPTIINQIKSTITSLVPSSSRPIKKPK